MIVPIAISVIALIISVISYFKKPEKVYMTDIELPKWEYTDDGIVFYDKTGKKILIDAE